MTTLEAVTWTALPAAALALTRKVSVNRVAEPLTGLVCVESNIVNQPLLRVTFQPLRWETGLPTRVSTEES